MSKTEKEISQVEWKNINWAKVEGIIFKLQKRIYRASENGNVKLVRKLQKMMVASWSAKLLAVRKVTQENKGRRTAGVDGIKSLNNSQRLKLAIELKLDGKSRATRRVWIPKPGKKEKRPLGIPTIRERAKQALLKLALEPEWEALFESNSHGFRPGRSTHDAIETIRITISGKPKYVLDGDIAKCFDQIDHQKLLDKINTTPKFRRQIKAWLKGGVMENNVLLPTESGTPQGGICSPLLANIALHGMQHLIESEYPAYSNGTIKRSRSRFGRDDVSQPKLINTLNPIIRGWCNYQTPWNSSQAYSQLNYVVFRLLWRWAKRRHPNKGHKWIAKKYWKTIGKDNWVFSSKKEDVQFKLHKHSSYSAGQRWTKVKQNRSPFDGDEIYWSTRLGDKYRTKDPQKARLLKGQQGKCHHCKRAFKPGDKLEKHHLLPNNQGGNNQDNNLVLLHLHCHDKIHRNLSSKSKNKTGSHK